MTETDDKFTAAIEQLREENRREREEARRQLQRRATVTRPKSDKLREYFRKESEADNADE